MVTTAQIILPRDESREKGKMKLIRPDLQEKVRKVMMEIKDSWETKSKIVERKNCFDQLEMMKLTTEFNYDGQP